ncbi:MAG: ABC transporter substrate-binding protein [Phenylobacterium sp.]
MRRALRIAAMGVAAAASLAFQPAAAAPSGKPQRILSMNLCADMLLLELVPRDRIAAVTYLAHDGAEALFPGADAGVAINHGTAEDIINLKPDLILAGAYSTAMTRRLAKAIGAPIVEVPDATTFDDIRRNLRQVGAAVGEPVRAEALVAQMDADLAALAALPPRRPIRVIAWSGGDSVPGRETLSGHIIAAAGAVNIAARPGQTYGAIDVEELLAARPDALLYGGGGPLKPSVRGEEGQHRVLRRLYAGRRIVYNDIAHTCGLPQSARSALDLRRALDALPQQRAAQ